MLNTTSGFDFAAEESKKEVPTPHNPSPCKRRRTCRNNGDATAAATATATAAGDILRGGHREVFIGVVVVVVEVP